MLAYTFHRVSLKAKIGVEDIERLLKAVRQRIEFEVSASAPPGVADEGTATSSPARRIRFDFVLRFVACLLPS